LETAHDFRKQHFKSPDAPDRRWLEWFSDEFSRKLYKLEIEPSRDTPLHLEATTRQLPDLAIAHSRRSPMRSIHRGVSDEEFGLIVIEEGRARVTIRGSDHELAAGMGGLGRNGTAAIVDVPQGARFLSIRLRRRVLEPLLRDFGYFSAVRDTQALRLLSQYLRMIETEEVIRSVELRHNVTTHVHDLVALAYGANRDAAALIETRGRRAARLAAAKQDILTHLGNPNLRVATLAARQGLTPRYIHKLFESEGETYSEFVVRQRLSRVHKMLTDPRFGGHSISAIALLAGFGDLSYFNRTFRAHYGGTPSAVRAVGAGKGA